VRNRVPASRAQFFRERIKLVHEQALAVTIDHVEFLRKQYGN